MLPRRDRPGDGAMGRGCPAALIFMEVIRSGVSARTPVAPHPTVITRLSIYPHEILNLVIESTMEWVGRWLRRLS